jgi:hypothetical protein
MRARPVSAYVTTKSERRPDACPSRYILTGLRRFLLPRSLLVQVGAAPFFGRPCKRKAPARKGKSRSRRPSASRMRWGRFRERRALRANLLLTAKVCSRARRYWLPLEPSFELLVTWAATSQGGAQWPLFLILGLLTVNRRRPCWIQQWGI